MEHVLIAVPPYRILACPSGLPDIYDAYREQARLAEEIELSSPDDTVCFFAIGEQHADWPALVVAQGYAPAYCFFPGILVVPETHTVFIGARERLLAYTLQPEPRRLWTDKADMGFWSWSRHGDVVLMSAELELAAWTTAGDKLWTTFVEPPWGFDVKDGRVLLDVMGVTSSFPIETGPERKR